MTKPKISMCPHLTFNGICEEAMKFYAKAFDGELKLMNYSEYHFEMPDEYKNKIMHSSLKIGDTVLMAADALPGQSVYYGNNFSLSISFDSVKTAGHYFNNISEGGTIIIPFAKNFWALGFGIYTDKYGIQCMINCEFEN